jgi:hypothetical protein
LCIVTLTGAEGQALAQACLTPSSCDLLVDDCPGDDACIVLDGANGVTHCSEPGELAIDEECVYANDCVAGASCLQFVDEDAPHCLQHCDTTALDPCPADHECIGLDIGNAGICRIE